MLNDLAKRIYDFNVSIGWHSNGKPDLATCLMNLHSEVSELWEAFRENRETGPCNKATKLSELGLPPLTCLEEELADVVIRALDTAHSYGIDIDNAVVTKMAYNATRGHRYGGKRA